MNCLAIAASKTHSTVIAFSFMSDHWHIIVSTKDIALLMASLRVSYTKYFNFRYLRHGRLGERGYYCIELTGLYHILAAIDYVLRNPVHHGLTATPFEYPYSSANCYFKKERGCLYSFFFPIDFYDGKNVGMAEDLKADKHAFDRYNLKQIYREQKNSASLMHNSLMPEKQAESKVFNIDANGLICNDLYMDTGLVEKWYGTPRSFLYRMNRPSSEEWIREQKKDGNSSLYITLDRIEKGANTSMSGILANERGIVNSSRKTDLEICHIIDKLIIPRVNKQSYTQLDTSEKTTIAEYLRKKYHSSIKQIKRCLALGGSE